MTTPCDIVAYVEELKGWSINHEEGMHHGRWDRPVHAVTVCWKATPGALEDAGGRGDDLIVGHESLYDPYDFDFNPFVRPGWQRWGINERRTAALDRYGLGYLRMHSSVDGLFVVRGFADQLGLGEPVEADNGAKVWEIEPRPLAGLVEYVKEHAGFPALRVCAVNGMEQRVRRVGLLIGGAGLDTNTGAQQRLVEAGCDVFVAGESDNYGLRFAAECGIPTIETSHETSEIPGLRRFADSLGERFPDLRISFYENHCPWVVA